jgi:hypothetical protein
MILVYEKDPALAADIARALGERGQEARQVETFYGVRDSALELKPAAVLFALDQNSVSTFGKLRQALDPEHIPVVAMGSRRRLYRAFESLQLAGWLGSAFAVAGGLAPRHFWFVEAPVAPGAARDAVERAIRETSAAPPRTATWRRRLALLAMVGLAAGGALALVAILVPLIQGRLSDRLLSFWVLLARFGLLLGLASAAVQRGSVVAAALRVRLRPPWWSLANLGLLVLLAAWLAWPRGQ